MTVEHSIVGPGNTADIWVNGLKQGGRYMDDLAVVQVTAIVDKITGQAVTGITLPITLTYGGSSPANGVYLARLPATADLTPDRWYTATVSAVIDDSVLTVTESFLAQERTA